MNVQTVKPDTRKRALYGKWQANRHLLMVLLKPHEGYVFHKAQNYEEYIIEKKKKEKSASMEYHCVYRPFIDK